MEGVYEGYKYSHSQEMTIEDGTGYVGGDGGSRTPYTKLSTI